MFRVGTKNPWSFSQGFNRPIDFCVWALEVDGLRVPPFEQHPDGDGSLRAAGLDIEIWRTWFERVVTLQYEFAKALQEQGKRLLKERQQRGSSASMILNPRAEQWRQLVPTVHAPVEAWPGNSAVRARLAELHEHYGPIANERSKWEIPRSHQWFKAERQMQQASGTRLYDQLRAYHTRLPTLLFHFISYPQSLDYLVSPVSVIMSATADYPDFAAFRTRALAAAAELASKRRGQHGYQSTPAPFQHRYQTYPLLPVQPKPERVRERITPDDPRKQVVFDWFFDEDELGSYGEIDLPTLRFERAKSIPGWQLYIVTFAETDGEQHCAAPILRQEEDGAWRVRGCSSYTLLRDIPPEIRAHMFPGDPPFAALAGSNGGHAGRDGGPPLHEFVAYGEIVDDGWDVARVVLSNEAGQRFESAVEDGLVLFATLQEQEILRPMQAAFYNHEGKLVGEQTVFDDRPRR